MSITRWMSFTLRFPQRPQADKQRQMPQHGNGIVCDQKKLVKNAIRERDRLLKTLYLMFRIENYTNNV